ncbi:MAG: hypothetical protein LBL24_05225 [Bacteroidales bacterium]|nr:hypothetical protein [Bacteroidales bacterium]
MLQTCQLTKRYEDDQLALDSLNLEIKPGQIWKNCIWNILGNYKHYHYHYETF